MNGSPIIAIVDDDLMVGESTGDLVETLGFQARIFTSADDFLKSNCVPGTSCVVTDVQMPGTSGLELHQKIIEAGRRIPVVFMTAFPDERVRKRALSAGAVCYLSKPVDGKSLLAHIRFALDSGNTHA
jgi:FixJ family two-component response regulator